MLLALDKGTGAFALAPPRGPKPPRVRTAAKALAATLAIAVACIGATRLSWEEDLRKFRQTSNPALALQEELGRSLGLRIQPLAVQLPLDEDLPRNWNLIAEVLNGEGIPAPHWASISADLAESLSDQAWKQEALKLAEGEGLDPAVLDSLLSSLRATVADPLAAPRSLLALMEPSLEDGAAPVRPTNGSKLMLTLPAPLGEEAQDRLSPALGEAGARLVGTRPLFIAIKSIAKRSIQQVLLVAVACIIGIAAVFGRRWLFVALALLPMVAGQAAVLGTLGWTGEPLTFLSLIAIPVALGVSVDTVFNLLNRARSETDAAYKVSRVNAVCAGTTLAGFGGLAFSSYKGLQGLGIAAIGGTAVALLATQWLLPWVLEKWPLGKR
jgi:hypothetical protein